MHDWVDASPIPTESAEQQTLFQWARMQSGKYPELELLYHVPNEGKRSHKTGARMKAEGLKSGVPDICLPVARGGTSRAVHRAQARKEQPGDQRPAGLDRTAGGAGICGGGVPRMRRGNRADYGVPQREVTQTTNTETQAPAERGWGVEQTETGFQGVSLQHDGGRGAEGRAGRHGVPV